MLFSLTVAAVTAASPLLEEGRLRYQELDYPAAEALLSAASRQSAAHPEERRETLDLLARTRVALGRLDGAEQAYLVLLGEFPCADEPADAAPKVRAVFMRAKEGQFSSRWVQLTRVPGEPARLSLVDPWRRVAWLGVVAATGEPARALTLPPGGCGVVDLSPQALPEGARVEARAADGTPLTSVELPPPGPLRALRPEARPSPPDRALPVAAALPPSREVSADASSPAPKWAGRAALAVAAGTAIAGGYFAYTAARDDARAGEATHARERRDLDASARERAITAYVLGGVAAATGTVGAVLVWRW